MKALLTRYLEIFTLVVVLVSIPFVWEICRKPLTHYEAQENAIVVRESNCRFIMKYGVAGAFIWSLCLLLRVTVKHQVRKKVLRFLPLVLLVFTAIAAVRVVQAAMVYPWFYD